MLISVGFKIFPFSKMVMHVAGWNTCLVIDFSALFAFSMRPWRYIIPAALMVSQRTRRLHEERKREWKGWYKSEKG
jgi:hypothetical protein